MQHVLIESDFKMTIDMIHCGYINILLSATETYIFYILQTPTMNHELHPINYGANN
jgi:hypothetical protein